MGLIQKLKDPCNGIRENAYIKKHSEQFNHQNNQTTGRLEFEVYQEKVIRDDHTGERMRELITINIGDKEVFKEEPILDDDGNTTGESEKLELVQIAYSDIEEAHKAFLTTVWNLIKDKKIKYSGEIVDLSESIDA